MGLDHCGELIVLARTSQLRECPVIFHLCFQAAIARWRFPLRGFLSDIVVALFEKLPCYTLGRWMHYNVKECSRVPTKQFRTVGATVGSGARSLRIQVPHLEYRSKSIAASFGLSPFPLRYQLTPRCSRRQLRFSTLPHASLPCRSYASRARLCRYRKSVFRDWMNSCLSIALLMMRIA